MESKPTIWLAIEPELYARAVELMKLMNKERNEKGVTPEELEHMDVLRGQIGEAVAESVAESELPDAIAEEGQ